MPSLLKTAQSAIDALYSDMSVCGTDVLDALLILRQDILDKIDSIRLDLAHQDLLPEEESRID